jgi:rhodanese-related sulfurtransferase
VSAISIPENSFERGADLLPKDKATLLVVYANDAGSPAIGKWAAKAASVGFTNLAVYAEGFPVWKAKKMPVVSLQNGR